MEGCTEKSRRGCEREVIGRAWAVPVLLVALLFFSVAKALGMGGEGTVKGTSQVWTSVNTKRGNFGWEKHVGKRLRDPG